jgi:hypothetical protein
VVYLCVRRQGSVSWCDIDGETKHKIGIQLL